MTWFERHKDLFTNEPFAALHGWLHQSEVHLSLNNMAGPVGVSRFMVYFRIDRGKILIEHIDSIPLPKGGGPPKNTSTKALEELKETIQKLRAIMSRFSFVKGCLGFVRDYQNEYELLCFFDEDVEELSLDVLPVPKHSYPLEEPKYLKLLGDNEYQLGDVVRRSSRVVSDWEEWEIEDNTLILHYANAPTQRHHVMVLGTFAWSEFWWNWQVEQPLFQEEAYNSQEYLATWDKIMELGYLTTVRIEGNWLFVGGLDDTTVLLGVVF